MRNGRSNEPDAAFLHMQRDVAVTMSDHFGQQRSQGRQLLGREQLYQGLIRVARHSVSLFHRSHVQTCVDLGTLAASP